MVSKKKYLRSWRRESRLIRYGGKCSVEGVVIGSMGWMMFIVGWWGLKNGNSR